MSVLCSYTGWKQSDGTGGAETHLLQTPLGV